MKDSPVWPQRYLEHVLMVAWKVGFFSWPWRLEAWDLIIIIVPLWSCREFMSIKSMTESFLFSLEDHRWLYSVTLRFQMHTHRHTELSLPHPQARGRQLIYLIACKQHFLLFWMKYSGIHSSLCSAKLRGKLLNRILLLFLGVKPLWLLHVRRGFPITSHLSFVKGFS